MSTSALKTILPSSARDVRIPTQFLSNGSRSVSQLWRIALRNSTSECPNPDLGGKDIETADRLLTLTAALSALSHRAAYADRSRLLSTIGIHSLF